MAISTPTGNGAVATGTVSVQHTDHVEQHQTRADQAEFVRAFVDVARAALLFTAPIAPLVALILTIGAYGAKASFLGIEPISFAMAMLCLFGGWVIIAAIWGSLGLTHRQRANLTAYCELTTQY